MPEIGSSDDLLRLPFFFRPNWGEKTRHWLQRMIKVLDGRLSVCRSTSQLHVSVSQGWICSDNFTCFHTETEVADQKFYLTQSQHTDIVPTSPSTDPLTPGTWQGRPLECQLLSHWYDSTHKNPVASGIQTLDLLFSRQSP